MRHEHSCDMRRSFDVMDSTPYLRGSAAAQTYGRRIDSDLLLAFATEKRGGLAVDLRPVEVVGAKVKFIDQDLGEGGRRHGQKGADKPKDGSGRQGEEQNGDPVQSHLFAEHHRNKQVRFDLLNEQDDSERQPEFCRAPQACFPHRKILKSLHERKRTEYRNL